MHQHRAACILTLQYPQTTPWLPMSTSAADCKAASQLLVSLIVTHGAAPYNQTATHEFVHRRSRSKPIAMTSLEPFERARERVLEKLTAKEKNELAGMCTIGDVWKVATDIQKKQAKLRKLGNMNKIRPYLDGLKRYDDVIKVLVSSNPGILALIWVGNTRYNSAVKTDAQSY